MESLASVLLIGVHEGRHFISFDVPGAFLKSEMADNKLVLLKLKGKFVEMICEINPEFETNICYETTKFGKIIKVLYMKYRCSSTVVQDVYGYVKKVRIQIESV